VGIPGTVGGVGVVDVVGALEPAVGWTEPKPSKGKQTKGNKTVQTAKASLLPNSLAILK
jgi:hypothetical protein